AHQMILMLTDSLRNLSEGATPAVAGAAPAAPHTTRVASAARRAPRDSDLGASEPAPGIVLPVIGQITSRFTRSRLHPLLHLFRPHKGVDGSAPAGTKITAPAAGRVTFVGRKLGDGLMVELDHGEGVVSIYAHCKSVSVRQGDFVSFGDAIATVGSSGLATGPHVHFEVRVRGMPVDPLRYLITARLTPRDPSGTNAADAGIRQAGSPRPAPEHAPTPVVPDSTTPPVPQPPR